MKNTSLVITSQFGKALLQEAGEHARKALQDTIVGYVRGILTALENQKTYIAQSQKNLALLQAQLNAVEQGAFEIELGGRLKFKEAHLNTTVMRMAECRNCGYNNANPTIR